MTPAGFAPSPLTLPTVVADAQLLPGEVAVAVVGAPAVVSAVRDVTRLAFPVLVTLTVHSAGGGVTRRALSMSRAVIGTGVDPERGLKGQQDNLKDVSRRFKRLGWMTLCPLMFCLQHAESGHLRVKYFKSC